MTIPVVLSYGMGVDSTAILLRWLEDPTSRDFELSQLIVLTAMVGDEFAETGSLVEAHILPRLREHGVRYVQIARNSASQCDGISVLSDSRDTDRVYLEGKFRLGQEMSSVGTLPEFAHGRRKCSIKFKGWPLDSWTEANVESPFRHIIGFNAGELFRIERDKSYSMLDRRSEYPLMDWGWTYQDCLDYIESVTGATWKKSCCVFCPFAGGNGVDAHIERIRDLPGASTDTLLLEHTALALNPRITLYSGKSLADSMRDSGEGHLVDEFQRHLATLEHKVYHVRRPYRWKGNAWRSVRAVSEGMSREDAEKQLRSLARKRKAKVERSSGSLRWLVQHREPGLYPTIEEFYVVCPSHVIDKQRKSFEEVWGLTHEFIERRRRPVRKTKRPSATQFNDSVVKLLGERSGFQEKEPVEAASILDDILRDSGIDPETTKLPLKGSKPLGLYRIVGFAFRNQRKSYSGKSTPLCVLAGRGKWALTKPGVALARALAHSIR